MKLIPLRQSPAGTTADLIDMLMKRAPAAGGFTPDQVLAGARVLKALREDSKNDALLLEDADHQTLVDALNRSQFGVGGEELAQMIVDIRDAKDPPKPAPPPIDEAPAAAG